MRASMARAREGERESERALVSEGFMGCSREDGNSIKLSNYLWYTVSIGSLINFAS